VESNPARPLPDNYHARLGQKMADENSKTYTQMSKLEEYAIANEIKINCSKTKFMLFNPTETYDFIPEYELEGKQLETQEEMKILGLTLSNDLKWRANTDNMTRKACGRLWMIKRLQKAGANLEDLTDIYTKQVRSVLEFGVPVWNSGINKEESSDIEWVQKAFLHIALGQAYTSYEQALDMS
jgi:hypothetical protein